MTNAAPFDLAYAMIARTARPDTCQCLDVRNCLTLSQGDIDHCHARRNTQSGIRGHAVYRDGYRTDLQSGGSVCGPFPR